jgi:hypothetical protein
MHINVRGTGTYYGLRMMPKYAFLEGDILKLKPGGVFFISVLNCNPENIIVD